ncbi:hypothetical protein [Amycolatopsis suaedae]|uniref:Uncharacterized protein n=1 Tax=Amycolatopsis suaedae TaxID=2510978 RepID=A0A4Q7IZW4_9PSEU|nr:hypothetical protein [Amycolatopsis suaedae]RZQ59812.1 hypothetical protein EWH70_32370 [Amycolatopsis suaedae]
MITTRLAASVAIEEHRQRHRLSQSDLAYVCGLDDIPVLHITPGNVAAFLAWARTVQANAVFAVRAGRVVVWGRIGGRDVSLVVAVDPARLAESGVDGMVDLSTVARLAEAPVVVCPWCRAVTTDASHPASCPQKPKGA